ncbi:MAG: FkbM family methyltransferase [Polaromonas sp.]
MVLKKYLKSTLARLAHSREYELIPAWSFGRQPLARHLRAIFERYKVDCVFDVGGNLGQYHDLLREDVGFEGLIFSFEPVSKYVSILKAKSVSDAKWRIFDFALGNADDVATINVTKSPGLNSFLEPRTDAVQGFWSADAVSGTEQVRIRVLDGIFQGLRSEHGFSAPYLKLDTQGFDLEVLKGASHSLSQFRALQTEASIKPLYQGMPDYQDVIEYLAKADFELSGMFPVSHDEALRLIEFDCLMINRLCAAKLPSPDGEAGSI